MYKIVIITIGLTLLSACASSGRSYDNKSCEPVWFQQPSKNPDIIFSYGQGKNEQQARMNAEAKLSRMLKSTISTRCHDSESRQSTSASGSLQNSKHASSCQTDSQSKLNLTRTPTTKLSQCTGQIFVRIDFDQRPLAKRLALDTLTLSPQEQDIITQTQGLPYSLMTRKTSNDKVHAAFNNKNQNWTLSTPTHTTNVNIDDFISEIVWQSCEGKSGAIFKLTHEGYDVDRVNVNSELEVNITVPVGARYLSIVNIIGKKGLKQLHKEAIALHNRPKNFNLQLSLILLPGHTHSHEIYLAIFTTKPQQILSSEHYTHSGSAMEALLKILNKNEVITHCALTLDIFQKEI